MPNAAGLVKAKSRDAQTARSSASLGLFSERKNIPSFTSLRFFPAIALVFYHACEYFKCIAMDPQSVAFSHAVTFFFVLSGFVLTLNYFNLKGIENSFQFLIARFARIWPAHILTLLLIINLVPEVFKVRGANTQIFLANLCLLQSWIPSWQRYFSFNAPSWSNSTELLFYLAFPLLILCLKKRWYLPAILTILGPIATISYCNIYHLPEFDPVKFCAQGLIYISPITRIFEFAVGMTSALFFAKVVSKKSINKYLATALEIGLMSAIVLIAVNGNFWRAQTIELFGNPGSLWFSNSIVQVFACAALLIVVGCERGYVSAVLSKPFFVWLGEISFGTYMLHCVFLAHRSLNFPQDQSVTACIIFFAVLIFSAHLMSISFETPVRRMVMGYGKLLMPSFRAKQSSVSGSGSLLSYCKDVFLKSIPDRKRAAFILVQAVALASLVYFGMPTINQIDSAQANQLIAKSNGEIKNLQFTKSLSCSLASASVSDSTKKSINESGKESGRESKIESKIHIDLLWRTTENQKLNTSVLIQAQDKDGNLLEHTTYAQDPRQGTYQAGVYFTESIDLPVEDSDKTVAIRLTLRNGKKRPIAIANSTSQDYMLIAVNR